MVVEAFKQNMWYVYVLLSQKDGERYIGSANNLMKRLANHNAGRVLSTKNRRPLVLIHQEPIVAEHEARAREKYLKTHKGYNELKKTFVSAEIGKT